jgi:hypothetical protein
MLDTVQTVEFQGITYNASHGSPFDRGSADSYYGRTQSPHKYPNGTGNAPCVEGPDMTLAEMREYYRGYEYNQESGERKRYD